jgi:hypothetical protein
VAVGFCNGYDIIENEALALFDEVVAVFEKAL